jgi:Protein of unknown function (DUF1515)
MTTATELAALTAIVQGFIKSAEKAADKADHDRAQMMRDIGELKDGQRQLSEDMAEVKPVTDMVTSLRSRMIGAGIVLGLIGAVAWAGVLFFKDAIIRFLEGG